MNVYRRIVVVAPLLLWFGLLMPAHQHARERAHPDDRANDHCTAVHDSSHPEHDDVPGDDHHRHRHDCVVCHFAAGLIHLDVDADSIGAPQAASLGITLSEQTASSHDFPRPFDGRAPPPSFHA